MAPLLGCFLWFFMQIKVLCMDIIGIYYDNLNQELLYLHFPRSARCRSGVWCSLHTRMCGESLCKLAPSVEAFPTCTCPAKYHQNKPNKKKDMQPNAALQNCRSPEGATAAICNARSDSGILSLPRYLSPYLIWAIYIWATGHFYFCSECGVCRDPNIWLIFMTINVWISDFGNDLVNCIMWSFIGYRVQINKLRLLPTSVAVKLIYFVYLHLRG